MDITLTIFTTLVYYFRKDRNQLRERWVNLSGLGFAHPANDPIYDISESESADTLKLNKMRVDLMGANLIY